MKWKWISLRKFRDGSGNRIQTELRNKRGCRSTKRNQFSKSGCRERNCIGVTVRNCATQKLIFESCLFKTRVRGSNFHKQTHLPLVYSFITLFPPPPPTGLWRFPSVRRRSIRPAALPAAGPRHRPAHHVHRPRPAEQPRQRLPGLLHLHHDMLLPASRNCRPHLFHPSEFN